MILLDASPSDWVLFFGHFHPVLVHLPVGMLVLAFLMYFFSKEKHEALRQKSVASIFLWASLSAFISCAMGWALSQTGEYDENTLFFHQWLGVSTGVISAVLSYMATFWSDEKTMSKLFKPVLWISLLLITLTGHLGGNLTHGSDYLTAYLPQPIRGWVGMEARAEAVEGGAIIPKIDNIQQAIVYQQLVQPVLKQKCWSCHNAEKQKGKLRMDTPEFLMVGGEDGAIIKAGAPLESEIIKRLLLDASEEHHMPPKGKTPMTEDEIAVLQWWVQHGADFKKKVVAMPADAKIKTILAKYASGTSETEPYWSPVFKMSISEADEDDILSLRKLGLLVNAAAKDQPFLEVNAVNAPRISDKELSDLASIQEQVVQLKLGQTKVTDNFMSQISDMPLLIQLDLDHTVVSDKGLTALENLKYLESINLYGTQVSDASISSLAKIKSLKRVYLWQTKFSETGVAKLKKMRPGLLVDFGFKGKWPLEIDTVKVEEKAKK